MASPEEKDDGSAYYGRVQHAVLALIRDHPGKTLDSISKGVSIVPRDVASAVLLLEERRLIVSRDSDENDLNSTMTYYPA